MYYFSIISFCIYSFLCSFFLVKRRNDLISNVFTFIPFLLLAYFHFFVAENGFFNSLIQTTRGINLFLITLLVPFYKFFYVKRDDEKSQISLSLIFFLLLINVTLQNFQGLLGTFLLIDLSFYLITTVFFYQNQFHKNEIDLFFGSLTLTFLGLFGVILYYHQFKTFEKIPFILENVVILKASVFLIFLSLFGKIIFFFNRLYNLNCKLKTFNIFQFVTLVILFPALNSIQLIGKLIDSTSTFFKKNFFGVMDIFFVGILLYFFVRLSKNFSFKNFFNYSWMANLIFIATYYLKSNSDNLSFELPLLILSCFFTFGLFLKLFIEEERVGFNRSYWSIIGPLILLFSPISPYFMFKIKLLTPSIFGNYPIPSIIFILFELSLFVYGLYRLKYLIDQPNNKVMVTR